MFTLKKKLNRILSDLVDATSDAAEDIQSDLELHRSRGVLDKDMLSKATAAAYANGYANAMRDAQRTLTNQL